MGVDGAAQRYIAEFVGTFVLVFSVGCNVITKQATWGVTSIACTLMVSIYALGPVSGGNFNPAVSMALGLARKISWADAGLYMCCQFAGGIIAGFSYAILLGEVFNLAPTAGYGFFQTMVAELIYTFMLCFVVLNVAASKMHCGKNEYYGLAIGFVVVAGGYGAGHISGGCFNPAVAFAIDVSSLSIGMGWCFMYAVFEFLGSSIAAFAFKACRPEEGPDGFDPPGEYDIGPKLISEFIGTYMLVVTVGLNVIGASPAPAFSIAASLTSMVFALGTVSGAHFNPAVTVAVLVSGRGVIATRDALAYIAVQICAGVCGGFTYSKLTAEFGASHRGFPLDPGTGYGWAEAMFAEVAFTFLLCLAVLNVATIETPLTEFFGLAIGACVIAGGSAIGAVSGGSLNPAVSFGIDVIAYLDGGHFWHCLFFSVFEVFGGCVAAGVFMATRPSEYTKDTQPVTT